MGKLIALEGNEAVAEAMRQMNPDVVAAYPITPQTEVVQKFAQFVSNGEVDTEYVAVESEHSAMSACVGAAAAGARVMTATCSQGLALMWEILYIASSLRLPIVMSSANRALSGNINIHCDHSDAMGARDTGWIQIFSENAQEAYDNLIQAVRIAEALRLPTVVNYDGFLVSHSVEGVEIEEDDAVREFVGKYENPAYSLLDLDNPVTVGPLDLQDFYFEHKRSQIEAYEPAKETILAIAAEFGEKFGRTYGLLELHGMDDADVAILACGSTAGTLIDVVEQARGQGIKAGLIKLRSFRPFPDKELAEAVSGVKALAVLDRCGKYGSHVAPLCGDATSALYMSGVSVPVVNYIYGLGGREIRPEQLLGVYTDLGEVAKVGGTDKPIRFLGVRDKETAAP